MTIFEERCKIKGIEIGRKIAELIGGTFKGYYSATDIIFKFKNDDPEKGVIVLRAFNINNRNTKNFTLTQKKAEWINKIKIDHIFLKEKFDTMKEATDFITHHYGESIKEDFSYSRDGWEYHLNNCRIFIENIENIGPTIEIESDNKEDLEKLIKQFNVTECFSEPVSETMRKLKDRSDNY